MRIPAINLLLKKKKNLQKTLSKEIHNNTIKYKRKGKYMYKQKEYLYYFSSRSETTFNIAFLSPYDEDHFNPVLSKSHILARSLARSLTHLHTHTILQYVCTLLTSFDATFCILLFTTRLNKKF